MLDLLYLVQILFCKWPNKLVRNFLKNICDLVILEIHLVATSWYDQTDIAIEKKSLTMKFKVQKFQWRKILQLHMNINHVLNHKKYYAINATMILLSYVTTTSFSARHKTPLL